ncbi:hypothetical protein [Suttonella ornithocola]|uniref:Uncharacterized protein n=1 Tax=Suttonella ornithocola TaxID=279832 RepID=A0A380MR23_9GAMM|nr:hypothetical protein [Suttonella ornithocola]SUO95050.1 Uncharacterised protein [Suttonella ornithocola]
MRRLSPKEDYSSKHKPEHQAGNLFPRAMFGLPILIQSKNENAVNANIEPHEEIGERMASPLILRAYYDGSRFQSCVLVLPYEIPKLKPIKSQEVKAWEAGKGKDIPPMRDNGANNQDIDPIQAFLHFFKK